MGELGYLIVTCGAVCAALIVAAVWWGDRIQHRACDENLHDSLAESARLTTETNRLASVAQSASAEAARLRRTIAGHEMEMAEAQAAGEAKAKALADERDRLAQQIADLNRGREEAIAKLELSLAHAKAEASREMLRRERMQEVIGKVRDAAGTMFDDAA